MKYRIVLKRDNDREEAYHRGNMLIIGFLVYLFTTFALKYAGSH